MNRLLIFCCTLLLTSFLTAFKAVVRPGIQSKKNIVLFYVENSKGGGKSSLSAEAKTVLETEVKKQYDTPNNKFLLFWSNDAKPESVNRAEDSRKILNLLFEKNSRSPNVWLDKNNIRNLLFDREFTLKDSIYINFFVTENYLVDNIIIDEPSVLTGMFPRELAYIAGADESKVTVNIYYSNTGNKITPEILKQVNNFDGQSKVVYHYIQVK